MTKNIPAPPHVDLNVKDFKKKADWGGYFPTVEDSKWYAKQIANDKHGYHFDRLRAIMYLLSPILSPKDSDHFKAKSLPDLPTVLDFGIGDGGMLLNLEIIAGKVIGVDISEHMINLAENSLAEFSFEGHVGSAEALKNVASKSVDLGICLNAFGYLSKEDQGLFFSEMKRIIKPNGYLIITLGIELFDLFALNSGTVEFFERNFTKTDVSDLLVHSRDERLVNASRRNPLNFRHELNSFGFNEVNQTFSQWHKKPPPIAAKEFNGDLQKARRGMRDYSIDPNTISLEHRWKANFLCSMFISLGKRNS